MRLFAACFALASCGAARADEAATATATVTATGEHAAPAIVGGDTDVGDPAVMLIQAHVPGAADAHICSGSLVSPHVIMTAAHCVDPATVGTGATFLVFDGVSALGSPPKSQFLDVQATAFDPAFNPDKNVFPTNGHDIAVVILKSPSATTPVRYNHAPPPSSLVGQPARIIGYGVTDGSDTDATTAGTRRDATTRLAGIADVLLTFEDGTHNICEGDSGGPAFMTVAGVDTVVGVTAFGDATCSPSTPGSDTRVDKWAAFVDGYVRLYDPPAKSGLAVGAACDNDLECASSICAQASGQSFCAEACSPASATTCPTGLTCSDFGGLDLCAPNGLAPVAKAGCDVSPGAPSPSAIALLPLVLLLALRRRRQ
jgi:MYXO-CTERM domain-containing protein